MGKVISVIPKLLKHSLNIIICTSSYSLTLIDSLDTLAVMGNFSEFRRVVDILTKNTNFDSDINVSVFETNIRIVGGLISAHLLSHKAGVDLEPGWPCNGPLLRLAEDVAKRLLPAFDTKTGMNYGTVNLKHGVPPGETSVTCTAGIGTFILEFGALSRLTGDPIYEEVALNALYALYNHRSPIGLFGNHIDVQTGRWTAQDAGIGAGVDSYYEYLVKGSLMLNRPELMQMFNEGRKSIDKYLKRDDWHIWVSMNKGQVTLPVFQSLEAYWPGVLSLFGDTSAAMKTLHNYHSVWKQYGFLPEFYNIPSSEAGANRENYPLRPELIESVMYLYRATGDPYLLQVGEDILRSIQTAKTPCGYATIKNVRDHRKEDRMESFFLAETTKYLYLLFDADNFLNNDGSVGTVIETSNGECVIDAGGYIFNTEAHPFDPSALRCCYDVPRQSLMANYDSKYFLGDLIDITERKDDENVKSDTEPSDIYKTKWINKEPKSDFRNSISVPLDVQSPPVKDNKLEKLIITTSTSDDLMNKIKTFEEHFDKVSKKLQEIDEKYKQFKNVKDDSLILPIEKKSLTEKKTEDIEEQKENLQIISDETPVNIIKLSTTSLETDTQANNSELDELIDKSTYKSSNDTSAASSSTDNNLNKLLNSSRDLNLNHSTANSIITEFVQSILKSTQPFKTKFDPQDLLDKIKTKGHYRNQTWNTKYNLLTCNAQPYLQRMTVLGEFF